MKLKINPKITFGICLEVLGVGLLCLGSSLEYKTPEWWRILGAGSMTVIGATVAIQGLGEDNDVIQARSEANDWFERAKEAQATLKLCIDERDSLLATIKEYEAKEAIALSLLDAHPSELNEETYASELAMLNLVNQGLANQVKTLQAEKEELMRLFQNNPFPSVNFMNPPKI